MHAERDCRSSGRIELCYGEEEEREDDAIVKLRGGTVPFQTEIAWEVERNGKG